MTIAIWVVLGLLAILTGFNFMACAVLYRDIQLLFKIVRLQNTAMLGLAAETGMTVRIADKAPLSQ